MENKCVTLRLYHHNLFENPGLIHFYGIYVNKEGGARQIFSENKGHL